MTRGYDITPRRCEAPSARDGASQSRKQYGKRVEGFSKITYEIASSKRTQA